MGTKIFEQDFDFGKAGEELFKKEIIPVLQSYLKITGYTKLSDKEDQKTKGDYRIGDLNYEIKTRKPSYAPYCGKDILIELSHIGNSIIEGWLNKYSDKTVLVYQYTEIQNRQLKLIYPIIFFQPYLLNQQICRWLRTPKLYQHLDRIYNWIIENERQELVINGK